LTAPAADVAAAPGVPADALGPGRPWTLSPQVGLRPERFGALAYHYGTRRLVFLNDSLLTDVVRALAGHDDVPSALAAHGVAPAQRGAYTVALARLAGSGVICERGDGDPQ
jgi:putative mycofactocin binding protein MftB